MWRHPQRRGELLRSIRSLQSDAIGSTTSPLSWPQALASLTPPNVGRAQASAAAGSQNIVITLIRGSQEYKIIAHLLSKKLVDRIIFRGTGKRISQVEKAAWHPGVDVEFQGCYPADSDYCIRWVNKTFKAAVTGRSGVNPEEQSILFANNLQEQTT